jgi:type IV pilus assembly protein PilW
MARRSIQHGLSIVELMVGIAIGLGVIAVATTLLGTSVAEGRRQFVEDRLLQDLRTASDLVGRNLRRSGHWGAALDAIGSPAATANPYQVLPPMPAASDAIAFAYSRDAVENGRIDANEQLGFRLRRGVLEMQIGSSGWQSLTEPKQMLVQTFEIRPAITEWPLPCADACRAGSIDCPPRLRIQGLEVTLSARSASDARVVRTLTSHSRIRNDAVTGRCEG